MGKRNIEGLQETIYEEILDNGLKVVLLPKPDMAKTYSIFQTKYGSNDLSFVPIDKNEKVTVPEGIAHFLEHKLFEKEDRDVFQDFTKQGASANAFTSFNKTAYLFSATSNIDENINTLLDFVQDPYFSDQSVEKEKGIIGQEIKMYDDQPDWRAFFGIIQTMYKEHPVRIDIAGTIESIDKITKEDLYTCYYTFYHPSNMIFFATGPFDPEQMMKLIKDNQSKKTFKNQDEVQRFFPEEPDPVFKKENTIQMPVSVEKVMVGVKEKKSRLTKENWLKNEQMLSMILDHYFSKSGDYYQKLYDEQLIDGSFHYETMLDLDYGFSLLGGNSENPEKLSNRIKEMLFELKNAKISDEEFSRMKRKKIGHLLRSMNSLEFISQQYIQYEQLGFDFFEVLPTVESLQKQEVEKFLSEWIDENQMAVSFVKAKG